MQRRGGGSLGTQIRAFIYLSHKAGRRSLRLCGYSNWHLVVQVVPHGSGDGTNTLGFIVWTLALAFVTWLATVFSNCRASIKGVVHPFVTAFGKSAASGLYTLASVFALAALVWSISIVVVVYRDHNSLTGTVVSLREQLAKRTVADISLRIKGWIDNQNQHHEAIVQVWLGIDNSGEADTLRGWTIAIKVATSFEKESTRLGNRP